MTIDGVEYVLMYFNFFTCYEQDMAKSKLAMTYYNNFYQGWHEWWWALSVLNQGKEKLKEEIIVQMAQEKLWQCNIFGWYKIKYLYIFQKVTWEGTWESFMEFFGKYHEMFKS